MNDNFYLTFTAAFPLDMAKKIFVKKFGCEPKEIFVRSRLLWLGPEPKHYLSNTQTVKAVEQ